MKTIKRYFYFFGLFAFCPGYFLAYGQLKADFSASSVSGCIPFNVQFKDLSTGNPAQWVWDFGNGITSTLQNPVATYLTKGTYTVRLIVKNGSGENFIAKQNYITVNTAPETLFSVTQDSGCVPLNASFINNTNAAGEAVKSWLWNFGDGATSTQQNTAHTYTTRGLYDVTLIAQNIAGCSDTFTITGAVKAGNHPTSIAFKGKPLNGCASSLRNFTDLSTPNINSWSWNFGDGGTDNSKNPVYHYTDTGFFNVQLTAGDNGCTGSVQYNSYIHVGAPIAKLYRKIDCSEPYKISFQDFSIGAISWNWTFGDGGSSTLKNPTHVYSAPGIYTTHLTVSSGGCIDTNSYTIYVVDQKPSFTTIPAKKSFCRNDSIQYITTKYDSLLTLYYAWSFDNGLTRTAYHSNTASIKYAYAKAGNYPSPILYIENKNFCYDTITSLPVTITGPVAGFKNAAQSCVENNAGFSDNSIPYKNSAIMQWKWNFGDGDSVSTAAASVNYKYSFPGLYNVLLKVTDADGCSDTISHTINILDKPVIDAGNDTVICAGKSVILQPTGGTTYTWANNPYLSCTNCTNPAVAPVTTTVFYVTGKNNAGCTAQDSVTVKVKQHQQLVVQPLTDTICAGNSVQLTASGYDYYKWQPATGLNNSATPNPLATPLSNTVYTVTATDKSGCFTSTASVNLIAGSKPVISIKDTEITVLPGTAYHINITYSADVTKWQWQPAQWLSDATIANPIAAPQQSTTYTVYAGNTAGCVSVDHVLINVTCNNTPVFMPNTFSPNGDGINDYFFPRSNNTISIKAFKIFNRWGQVVFKKDDFSTNDQNAGWNGKYNGAMQQSDVYMYILQSACANGKVFTNHGSVTLIK